jgi:hypothetical protein
MEFALFDLLSALVGQVDLPTLHDIWPRNWREPLKLRLAYFTSPPHYNRTLSAFELS